MIHHNLPSRLQETEERRGKPYRRSVPIELVSPEERDRRVVYAPMERILEQVGQHPHFSDRETKRLIRRYQEKGDLAAKEKVVTHNIGLVIDMAKPLYKRVKSLSGTASISFEDLVQEGIIGLIRAIEKCDVKHESKAKFSTYASHYISSVIHRYIKNQASTIRLPVHVHEEISRYDIAVREATMALQRQPTDEEIAHVHVDHPPLPAELLALPTDEEGWLGGDVPEFRVQRVRISYESAGKMVVKGLGRTAFFKVMTQPRSLNFMLLNEGKYSAQFSTDSEDPVHEVVAQELMAMALDKELDTTLSDKEQKIIELRFGLTEDGKAWTLDEVARTFNVTRERIRQIESMILKKIRSASSGNRYREAGPEYDVMRREVERQAYRKRTGKNWGE